MDRLAVGQGSTFKHCTMVNPFVLCVVVSAILEKLSWMRERVAKDRKDGVVNDHFPCDGAMPLFMRDFILLDGSCKEHYRVDPDPKDRIHYWPVEQSEREYEDRPHGDNELVFKPNPDVIFIQFRAADEAPVTVAGFQFKPRWENSHQEAFGQVLRHGGNHDWSMSELKANIFSMCDLYYSRHLHRFIAPS